MRKISDQELAAGLRQRKHPEAIAAEVRETIVSQMHADAMRLPMSQISSSPYQVRQVSDQSLEDLMESIRDTNGLITPIVVRPSGDSFELIAGHTRYMACARLGYRDISAVVRPMSDAEAARALAADNLTRKDLSDYEIFKQLRCLFDAGFLKSNSEASRLLGRTRQDIIRYLSYARLPAEVVAILEERPDLLGAAATKELLSYLPQSESLVIEATRRLAAGRFKTQVAAIAWIEQHLRDKPIRNEQRVLDQAGATVGKIVWSDGSLKVVSRTVDLAIIEAAMKKALQDEGYRL